MGDDYENCIQNKAQVLREMTINNAKSQRSHYRIAGVASIYMFFGQEFIIQDKCITSLADVTKKSTTDTQSGDRVIANKLVSVV